MKLNKNLTIIFVSLILVAYFAQAIQEPNIYYKFNLHYNEGIIDFNSTDIEIAFKELENVFGFYTADSLDYNDERINTVFFEVPNVILWDGVNPKIGEIENGGSIELREVSFELYVPYHENTKKIIIYNESIEEVLKIDVSMYSKEYEKSISLTDDEEIDEDGQIEEEIKMAEEKNNRKNLSEKLVDYWWILLILFLILLIILFSSLRKPDQ